LKKNIKDYNLDELKEKIVELGEKPYRAEQIFKWIFVDNVTSFDDMTNLSLDLRNKLKENFDLHVFNVLQKQESKDGTKKYLFDVLDGNAIESVLMEYKHGFTICVSSQIGCKMGCKFCASTGVKFSRNLTSGEIVEQLLAIQRDQNIKISNLVFMGIGEPLDNYDNVMNAIKILNNPKGINMGARHISISTSGLVPKIYKLADENIQSTLSISLHSANNKKRSEMMPVNNTYNIEELIKACKYYIEKTNKRISFEYALAKENNDNLDDAKELVKLLKGMLCHVNLIPINKIENGEFVKSTNENIQCTLSISLHATNNEKRSKMMPVNNVYNIEQLIQACKDYIKITNRRISFEYALAKDNNDNLEDAKELVKLLKGMLCHVNLIPINKIENGEFVKSNINNIMKFRDYLNENGIVATIRRELGSDIDAACGQLRRKNLK